METANQTTENKNVNGLLKALEYNGFGALSDKMVENINRQRDQFTLYAADKEPDTKGQHLRYELNFGSKNGKYYWNTTKATLSSPDPLKNGRQHSFYAGRYAANQDQMKMLLSGTSLFRPKLATTEGKLYQAWQKIHFNEEKDQYGNHPLRNYYENNGPRIEDALAKWNDVLSMNNGQRALAFEQWKKGEAAVLTVNVKENNAVKPEKAVVFFDAQFKDLMIIRSSGEVLERDKNRSANIMAVEPPPRELSQASSMVATPPPGNGNQPAITPEPKNQSPEAPDNSRTVTGDAIKGETKNNKDIIPDVPMEDRQSKSEKRGVKHGR